MITSVYDDRVHEEQPLGQRIVVEYIRNIHYAQRYWLSTRGTTIMQVDDDSVQKEQP